jgi:hypothetical protein
VCNTPDSRENRLCPGSLRALAGSRNPPDRTGRHTRRCVANRNQQRPPEVRRSLSFDVTGRAARISSEPAVACERAGCRFGRRGDGHSNHHRIPAPRLMAMVARSMSAVVKRARFAFTKTPSSAVLRTWSGGRAVLRRSSTQDPWLCVSTSRWICPGRPLSGRPVAHVAKVRRHRSGDHGKLVLPPSRSECGVALEHRLRRPVVVPGRGPPGRSHRGGDHDGNPGADQQVADAGDIGER